MSEHIGPILAELLFYRESSFEDTKVFAGWKHNRQLCPWLEHQINQIRDSFLKYQSVAYDFQGVHDLGTDVVLRYDRTLGDNQAELRFIAFQVKSNDDLKDPHYLKNLRSQWVQALGEYRENLDRYYILLCADIRSNADRIREIKKTMSMHEKVVVVDPAYALTFLRLSSIKISSIVDAFFREEDEVVRQGKGTLGSLSPAQAALTLVAVSVAIFEANNQEVDLNRLKDDPFLRSIYSVTPDYPNWVWETLADQLEAERPGPSGAGVARNDVYEDSPDDDDDDYDDYEDEYLEIDESYDRKRSFDERWTDDVDILMDALFRPQGPSMLVQIDRAFARPLEALLLDAAVRYGYEREDLYRFLFGILGVMEQFGLSGPGEEDSLPEDLS